MLIEYAERSKPNEVSSILFGKYEDDKIVTYGIFETSNENESPTSFAIPNDELLHGYKEAEKRNLQIIGIFHSHPISEAYPSQTDKKFMMINPIVWAIYSGLDKKIKAFILDDEIKEVAVVE